MLSTRWVRSQYCLQTKQQSNHFFNRCSSSLLRELIMHRLLRDRKTKKRIPPGGDQTHDLLGMRSTTVHTTTAIAILYSSHLLLLSMTVFAAVMALAVLLFDSDTETTSRRINFDPFLRSKSCEHLHQLMNQAGIPVTKTLYQEFSSKNILKTFLDFLLKRSCYNLTLRLVYFGILSTRFSL